jgi:hypothetical protein
VTTGSTPGGISTFFQELLGDTAGSSDPSNQTRSDESLCYDMLKLWPTIVSSVIDGPVMQSELLQASAMDVTTFAKSLESLREARLIEIVGAPGHQTVQLTVIGAMIAQPTP